MRRCLFFQVYDCNLTTLKKCRSDINEIAKRLQWPPQIVNPLLLSSSELIANSTDYSQKPKATSISISIYKTADHLIFEYRDNGGAFNPLNTPPPELDDISPLAEHGRGLSLIKATCQQVAYKTEQAPFVNCIICHINWPQKSQKIRVLLLEDNPAQNYLYAEYLRSDYTVIACHEAQEAINAIEKQPIDIVVSDISMPGINGIDFRKSLLGQSTTDLIPFMFLTGTEDMMNIERLAHLGIDDFLQKPATKAQLIASIERILQRTNQLINRVTERLDHKITRALYPSLPPHVLSWQLAYGSRNTGHGGGDAVFLEATPNPTLVLLDIMGHDISAKFFAHAHTGYLRGLVRSMTPCQAGQPPFDCAVVLDHLSDMAFADNLLSHTILTTLVIELLNNGQVCLASGGHPPPLIVSNGKITRLECGGMLPGLIAQNRYQSQQITLKQGERLVLYSDGLFEGAEQANNRAHLEQSMLDAIAGTCHQPIHQAVHEVMKTFDVVAGKPSDDATLLMLETYSSD